MPKSDKERLATLEQQNLTTKETIKTIFDKINDLPDLIGKKIDEKFDSVEKLRAYKEEQQTIVCGRRGKVVEKLKNWMEKEKLYIGVFSGVVFFVFSGLKWITEIIFKRFF